MKKLKLSPQMRIRACDRILKKEYWKLRKALRERLSDVESHDVIQERINYFEETKERIEISL